MRKPRSAWADQCPVRDVLDRVSDRWSILVIQHLQPGTMRFTELRRAIPDISQRMLAQTLRRLEQDGYVGRKVYPTIPPRVDYSLSSLGHSLMERLEPLVAWAADNHEAIRGARSEYLNRGGLDPS